MTQCDNEIMPVGVVIFLTIWEVLIFSLGLFAFLFWFFSAKKFYGAQDKKKLEDHIPIIVKGFFSVLLFLFTSYWTFYLNYRGLEIEITAEKIIIASAGPLLSILCAWIYFSKSRKAMVIKNKYLRILVAIFAPIFLFVSKIISAPFVLAANILKNVGGFIGFLLYLFIIIFIIVLLFKLVLLIL